MRTLAMALAVLISSGCELIESGEGGEETSMDEVVDGTPPWLPPGVDPELIGGWFASVEACVVALRFNTDAKFTRVTVCDLGPKLLGASILDGTYLAVDGVMNWDIERATCAAQDPELEMFYHFWGADLMIKTGPYEVNFRRATPQQLTGMGGVSRSGIISVEGCFDGGEFMVRQLQPL